MHVFPALMDPGPVAIDVDAEAMLLSLDPAENEVPYPQRQCAALIRHGYDEDNNSVFCKKNTSTG